MNGIVVSGFSGKFPECDNVEEFEQKLFNGVDMVTSDDRRWLPGIYGTPTRNGKLKDLSRFDALFFGIAPKQADDMDPQLRILIENVYEAIVDAGYNPEELKGRKIGVFVGQTTSESMDLLTRENIDTLSGYILAGGNRNMVANRVSFTFDFCGISLSIDTACSSALVAFHLAVEALERGEIEGAIVGGVNILLHPSISVMFFKLNMLSEDGKCKSFDSSGNGYVRSETVGALFLQRAKDARRVYAQILGTGSNVNGYCEMGITYPVIEKQATLIQGVLQKSKITPDEVTYFEAHGTGTKAGDTIEVNAIHRLLCHGMKRRKSPLLIGSVKSNIGHGEAAATIGQIAKVILAMERGIIPANLHFVEPNPSILGFKDGSIKVVDRNLPWNGGIIAVNSFGFGGSNAHALLKSNPKEKSQSSPFKQGNIPNLIVCSGRTEEAVHYLLNKACQFKDDNEFSSLLREIYKINTPRHLFRGFQLDGDSSGPVVVKAPSQKQIWYIFPGMGSQCWGTVRALLPFKPFADAVNKCAKALESVGIDLMDMILKDCPLNAANSLLCIALMQIGLVDLLKSLGVTPDYFVGHSAGEMGCAYADGGFTAEEAIRVAHERGQSLKTSNASKGAMVAVSGLTWEEIQSKLPNGVYAACHNTRNNVSISGCEIAIKKFVEDLSAAGIASRPIDSSGFAFHCPSIVPVALAYKKAILKMGIPEKKRTAKWISTCVPANCSEDWASVNSAEYHAFNVSNQVLFKEAIDLIPEGSIVVELGPHSLLRGLLRQSAPDSTVISLVNKNAPDGLSFFLKELGNLYNCGVALDLKGLYPPVVYPVSRGTPMISNLVKWDHSSKWQVASAFKVSSKSSGQYKIEVDMKKEEMRFLDGHVLNGKNLLPLTSYLVFAWKAFAAKQKLKYDKLPVVFSDIHINRASFLPAEGSIILGVDIFEGGAFEVLDNENMIAVTGHIKKMEVDSKSTKDDDDWQSTAPLDVSSDEVYKLLKLRCYEYTGLFRGIESADAEGNIGRLRWADNWITFIDTMMQFEVYGIDSRKFFIPVGIKQIHIDPRKHLEILNGNKGILVRNDKNIGTIKSGGVEIRYMKKEEVRKREQRKGHHLLERQVFVPYMSHEKMDFYDAVKCCMQIVVENTSGSSKIKVREFHDEKQELKSPLCYNALEEEPRIFAEIVISSQSHINLPESLSKRVKIHKFNYEEVELQEDVIVATNLGENRKLREYILPRMKHKAFILCFEDGTLNFNPLYELIAKFSTDTGTLSLYWKADETRNDPCLMVIDEGNFAWVERLKNWIHDNQNSNNSLFLVSSQGDISGLVGFVKCLRSEELRNSIRVVLLPNELISAEDTIVVNQVKKGLAINVLKDGVWGSYRHLKLLAPQTSDSIVSPRVMTSDAYVDLGVKGDLSSFRWVNSPLGLAHKNNAVDSTVELCTVDYSSLNFRDIMIATGKLSIDALPGDFLKKDPGLGLEFVGRNSSGKKVMGLLKAKGIATSVEADKMFLWDIPDHWSLEQASSIPMAYSTAYYALLQRGRLRKGESILIHSGCSTVGLAAISIALNRGCEVFATVGSENKRDFLLEYFRGLKETNIGNSRNTTFERMVLEETKGRGVDLVLNFLAGDLLNASVRCLADNGRFLEIGKVDLAKDSPLGMSMFLKNSSFHGILLDALLESKSDDEDKQELFRLVKRGISSGEVKPLPVIVFQRDELEKAFRFMAAGKHIGKVVLKIRSVDESSSSSVGGGLIPVTNKSYMDPNKCYIIVGGLGGYGLELADWLITRGATKIVLSSRLKSITGFQKLCIRRWEMAGIQIKVCKLDCSTEDNVRQIINEGNKLGDVGAIYNLASILRDGLFMNFQNERTFEEVCAAKIRGSIWLDRLSRQMCPHLDAFVTFSSVVSGRGNAGQTNYGYANSAMERLCEKRFADGFPALSIQWGAIGDVGMTVTNLFAKENVKIAGTWPQKIASCLETLDIFLTLFNTKIKLADHQEVQRSAILSSMFIDAKDVKDSTVSQSQLSFTSFIAGILGIKDPKKLGAVSLTEIGMDSLMATEVKEAIRSKLDIELTAKDVRNLTFDKLEELNAKQSSI